MDLTMKNYFWSSLKNNFLGRELTKIQYKRGNCLKGGVLGQFPDLNGAQKEGGEGIFERGGFPDD